jgi:ribosomal-protein-alanine N-acetyltransferase
MHTATDDTHKERPSGSSTVADTRAFTPAGLATAFVAVRTDRLILRQPQGDDGPAMFAIHGDPATNRYNPAGPDPDPAASEETLRGWLCQWESDSYGYWAITPLNADTILGFGGVMRRTWRDRDVLNLYYRLTPDAWGRGYATEVARTAVGLARSYLPHLPVIARTRPTNIASIRTAERAGLVRRPDLDTEHIVFALGWRSDDHP